MSRPPHAASRDCRNGSPLARAIPCAPAPEYGDTRKKEKTGERCRPRGEWQPAFRFCLDPHAAQRAVPGWRGGLGGGADLASAGSMRPPPSPARHVSTASAATTNQANGPPPQTPAEKQHATTNAGQATTPIASSKTAWLGFWGTSRLEIPPPMAVCPHWALAGVRGYRTICAHSTTAATGPERDTNMGNRLTQIATRTGDAAPPAWATNQRVSKTACACVRWAMWTS